MQDLYRTMSPADKLRMAVSAKEIMSSEAARFVFDELDYRVLTALKENTCDSTALIDSLQSLNTLRIQLEYWANQCETQQAAVDELFGDKL